MCICVHRHWGGQKRGWDPLKRVKVVNIQTGVVGAKLRTSGRAASAYQEAISPDCHVVTSVLLTSLDQGVCGLKLRNCLVEHTFKHARLVSNYGGSAVSSLLESVPVD